MKTIGLVGGVASGKSRVGQMLVELGAGLLDADRAGHEVLAGDAEVHKALRGRWGNDVFTADGKPDRAAIARRVFGEAAAKGTAPFCSADSVKLGPSPVAEREFLEALLHPRIRDRLEAEGRKMAIEGRPAVVLDAPLLLEAGWGPMCDVILMVDANRETRVTRALQRGWTEAQFDEREAAQWPIVKKRGAAHVVIHNDGAEQELRRAVRDFWNLHVAPAK